MSRYSGKKIVSNVDIGDVNLLNTSGVAVDPATSTAQASLLAAVSGIECLDVFNKTITDFAAEGAVAITESSSTCKFVHISAPFNTVTQSAKNTSVVLVGSSADAGKRLRKLHPSDIDGFDFPCTDPSEVFIEAFADGDGVDVEVFGVPS